MCVCMCGIVLHIGLVLVVAGSSDTVTTVLCTGHILYGWRVTVSLSSGEPTCRIHSVIVSHIT